MRKIISYTIVFIAGFLIALIIAGVFWIRSKNFSLAPGGTLNIYSDYEARYSIKKEGFKNIDKATDLFYYLSGFQDYVIYIGMTFHDKEGWNVVRESFNINQNEFSDSLSDDFKHIQGPRLIGKDNLNVMWDPKQMTTPYYYKKEDRLENGKLRIKIIIYDPDSGRLLYSEALL